MGNTPSSGLSMESKKIVPSTLEDGIENSIYAPDLHRVNASKNAIPAESPTSDVHITLLADDDDDDGVDYNDNAYAFSSDSENEDFSDSEITTFLYEKADAVHEISTFIDMQIYTAECDDYESDDDVGGECRTHMPKHMHVVYAKSLERLSNLPESPIVRLSEETYGNITPNVYVRTSHPYVELSKSCVALAKANAVDCIGVQKTETNEPEDEYVVFPCEMYWTMRALELDVAYKLRVALDIAADASESYKLLRHRIQNIADALEKKQTC